METVNMKAASELNRVHGSSADVYRFVKHPGTEKVFHFRGSGFLDSYGFCEFKKLLQSCVMHAPGLALLGPL